MSAKGRHLLAIDVGTSRLKVGLFDYRAALTSLATVPYEVVRPRPSWAEIHPDVWWEAFLRGLKQLSKRDDEALSRIDGIGLSVLYPALTALDSRGTPLRPAILYSDQRSVAQAREIRALFGPTEYLQTTGNLPSPGTCSLCSILWLRQNEPDLYRKVDCFGHANTYFAWRLTGNPGIDWSNASLTGCFEAGGRWVWSDDICTAIGLAPKMLPQVLPPGSVVGKITQEASRQTGLPAGIPVATGAGDTACAALGMGVGPVGQIGVSCGSSDSFFRCLARPAFDHRLVSCCYVKRGYWLSIGTMSSTGASWKWFLSELAGIEMDGADYERFLGEVGRAAHGKKIVFLPYLQGERTPVWDPKARGVFLGLDTQTTKADLAAAVLRGTALGWRQIVELFEELAGDPITGIRTSGGASHNRVWNQMKADALARPVKSCRFSEFSLLGAAILGGLASGVTDGEAAQMAERSQDEYLTEPDSEMKAFYDGLYRVYTSLYPSVRELFERLERM